MPPKPRTQTTHPLSCRPYRCAPPPPTPPPPPWPHPPDPHPALHHPPPQLLSISEDQANTGGPLTGTLVWMYAHESYPDYDGYTVRRGACCGRMCV